MRDHDDRSKKQGPRLLSVRAFSVDQITADPVAEAVQKELRPCDDRGFEPDARSPGLRPCGWRLAHPTVQLRANPSNAAVWCDDPGTITPGWIVSDVLPMAAFQICDPVALFILMEAGDGPNQPALLSLAGARIISRS